MEDTQAASPSRHTDYRKSPELPVVRAFSGDFIRFQAKMRPPRTISGKRPGWRHKFVIICPIVVVIHIAIHLVVYTYIVSNGDWRLRIRQRSREGYFEAADALKERLLSGRFPGKIREQFLKVVDWSGIISVQSRNSPKCDRIRSTGT